MSSEQVGIAEIKISKGNTVIVDFENYDELSLYKWYSVKGKNGNWYSARDIFENGKRKVILMHRHIIGAKHGEVVDHKNCNGLDNRKQNLRTATYSQNNMNRRKGNRVVSKYKGVSKVNERKGMWRARIMIGKKEIYICKSKDEKKCALAYNKKASEIFGDFALLNVVG
jgi:hypothetical protein